MVEVDDEVELTKNRIGIIRYKGPLDGKNGIFYGVELTQGQGKHSGIFRGKRYFRCHHEKGIFIKKKQLLYKLEPTKQKRKHSNKSKTMGASSSQWKPPSFMKDIMTDINNDCGWLDERYNRKVPHKTRYDKAAHIPHAKWKKQIYKTKEWEAFLKDIHASDDSSETSTESSDPSPNSQHLQHLQHSETESECDKEKEKELKELKAFSDKERERQRKQDRQRRKELREERRRLEEERREMEELALEIYEREKADKLRREAIVSERKKLEKAQKLLREERERHTSVVLSNSYYDIISEGKNTKVTKPKTLKKEYKIFFSVNVETNENSEHMILNQSIIRYLLSDLFESVSEKDIFEIKSLRKGNGFKIDFGIKIETCPSEYINRFDDLTMDGSLQDIIKEGLDLEETPLIHIWEARYEKIKPKKHKKTKYY